MTASLFSDSALADEHFGILFRKTAQMKQGNLVGGLLWGCAVERVTNPVWLDAVMNLHGAVRAALSPAKKGFLLPKEPAYFEKLIAGEGGQLWGAYIGVDLVGITALVEGGSVAQAVEKKILTAPQEKIEAALSLGEKGPIWVVQSHCIHPDFAGQKVGGFLLNKVMAQLLATQRNAALFAQVAADNQTSWCQFLARSMGIVGAWTQGHPRFLLKYLSPQERKAHIQKQKHAVMPFDLPREGPEASGARDDLYHHVEGGQYAWLAGDRKRRALCQSLLVI